MDLWTTVRPVTERIDPRAVDMGLAVVMTGFGLRQAFGHYPAGARPFDVIAVVLSLVANMSVAARRRAPMIVLFLSCGAVGVYQLSGYWIALNQLGPQLAFSTVAALRPKGHTLVGAVVLLPLLLACNLSTWPNPPLDVVFLTASWVVVLWAFGSGVRQLFHYNRQLVERNARLAVLTEQLAVEHQKRARRAVLDERIRIARELHDVVAHHMSVIAVQAELATYIFDSDPPTARRSLATIAEVGRETLGEMRHLLTALRPGPEGAEGDDVTLPGIDVPAPGLDRLPELAERIRAAGVPLEFRISGTPRSLADGLDLCAYRVVQESLTNIVKHARPQAASLTVEYRPRQLVITVVNDGCDSRVAADISGPGHGLIGMAERARIYGGTLSAGPRPDGRFLVCLTLQLPGAGATRTTISASATEKEDPA